jgi:adenylate cyclase
VTRPTKTSTGRDTLLQPDLSIVGCGAILGLSLEEVGSGSMTVVTDPVCGMRIDPDDAVATAEHDGQLYWFCSEACRDAFAADPDPARDRLTREELARRSGAGLERIRELVALGILEAADDGTFPRRDVMRTRVVAYLQTIGIGADDLGQALGSGHLTLGYMEAAGRQHPKSRLTHAEASDQVGVPFETLERVFVAFGLRPPHRDGRVREDDLAVLDILRVLVAAGVETADVLRMARVWGDSTRRIAQYLPHYFHDAVEVGFKQRGLGDNQAYEAAIREVGMRIGRSGEDLLGWLFRRHSEVFMTAHQLDHIETALEDAGVRRRPPRTPEAAVFADLSGYTTLTEESGDEVAADVALTFAQLVSEVATKHRGSIVKLLGDGVLLHFADPGDAVRASLELAERAPAQGLPPTHIGVNAGPMLYDQGDYFGRTVNLASRIASHAGPGRIYVGESLVGTVPQEGFTLSELGAFDLKGVAEPVTIYEALPVR